MKCVNCEHENLKGAAFCGLCGFTLEPEAEPRGAEAKNVVRPENPTSDRPVFVYQPKVALTDEALALENVCFAGIWRRFFSTVIDGIIVGILLRVLLFAAYSFLADKDLFARMFSRSEASSLFWPIWAVAVLVAFVVPMAYVTFFMGKNGGTPGQRFLGTVTLHESGGKFRELGYAKSFLRAVVYLVVNALPLLGIVSIFTILFSKKRRALHDMICRTVVVGG